MVDGGLFISFEGGEGVGKSTQVARLADALRTRGHDVIVTREPGGSAGAEAIRTLLMDGQADRWNPAAEALLFAAARSDHVARVIRPALAAGRIIICDRFIDSTRAYQGGAGGMDDADIMALHDIGSGGLLPHRTLLLTLEQDVADQRAQQRDGGKADRFAKQDAAYHARVARRFLAMAGEETERFRVIDADGTPDAVSARIRAGLSDLLP